MIAQTLNDVGLSMTESKIYESLVDLGPSPATSIAKETGIHRANVYSSLHKMSKKGLISSSKIDNRVLFSASDPNVLLSLIKEKESSLLDIIPQLISRSSLNECLDFEVISGLSATISLLFELEGKQGEICFVGDESLLPIGLSAKLSLLFNKFSNNINLNKITSSISIIFRENLTLIIFSNKEFKTLKIKSKEFVSFLELLLKLK